MGDEPKNFTIHQLKEPYRSSEDEFMSFDANGDVSSVATMNLFLHKIESDSLLHDCEINYT